MVTQPVIMFLGLPPQGSVRHLGDVPVLEGYTAWRLPSRVLLTDKFTVSSSLTRITERKV